MQIKRTENHVSEKPRKLARGIGFIGVHRKYVHSRAVGCAWRLNSTCKTTSWGPDSRLQNCGCGSQSRVPRFLIKNQGRPPGSNKVILLSLDYELTAYSPKDTFTIMPNFLLSIFKKQLSNKILFQKSNIKIDNACTNYIFYF